MADYGEQFLSRILDDGTTQAIRTHSVEESDFATETERKVFRFITDYAKENRGQAPDYRTVVERHPEFYYREGVADSYSWMVKRMKSNAGKRAIVELLSDPKTQKKLDELDGNDFINLLQSELNSITMRTSVREKIGTSMKYDAEKIKDEYFRRKSGESFKIWRSKFSIINDNGGYVSSNVYVPYGKTGRGKSAITLEESLYLAEQGANVLIWSMEMGWFEALVRLFVSYSAKHGVTQAEIDGQVFEAGFESRGIRQGTLSEEFEQAFLEFVDSINDTLAGNIIVRGVDDEDFNRKDLRQLETEIIQTNADVVVLDPFYYLDYEKNTSKTAGGDAANTSSKLRGLAGRTQTVVFAITQADETTEEEDENGNRELELPKRKDVSKTKQLMQDAAILIPIDTNHKEGRGLVGINKGRDGGEGDFCDIIYLPQIGIVQEFSPETIEAEEFTKQF